MFGLRSGTASDECSVDGDRRTSAELGAADHLVKPFGRDVLAASALRRARQRPVESAPCDGVEEEGDPARSA